MRKCMAFLTAAALVLTLGLAPAQPPEGGRGKGGGMMSRAGGAMLIAVPKVQDDLKLSDDQKAKFKAFREEQMAKMQDMFAEGRPDPDKIREMTESAEKKINDILTSDQQKRYQQIKWQQASVAAFNDKKVQEALDLSDEQKEKVKGLAEDFQQDSMEIRREAGRDMRAANEKITALRKETMEKITGVLTDKQKEQWKGLIGKPLELKPEDFQGMMGGRPGGKGGERSKKADPPKKIDD